MTRDIRRTTTLVFSAAAFFLTALLALPIGVAQARTFNPDYNDGKRVVRLPQPRGYVGAIAGTCRVVGGRLRISGELGQAGAAKHSLGLYSIRAANAPTLRRSGEAWGAWRLQRIPTGFQIVSQEFGADGSFVYATQRYVDGKNALRRVNVYRVLPSGRRDRAFGKNGVVRFSESEAAQVRALPGERGTTTVILETPSQTIITRLMRSGDVDKRWGAAGRVTFEGKRSSGYGPETFMNSASLLPGGGMLFLRRSASVSITSELVRLTPAGLVDTSFAGSGSWQAPAPTDGGTYSATGEIVRTLALSGGKYLIAYVDHVENAAALESVGYVRMALVDPASGSVDALRSDAGVYNYGGDAGFPDAYPWRAFESSKGPLFGFARTYYRNTLSTFLGAVSSFGPPFGATATRVPVNTTATSIGDFAGSPKLSRTFACGAEGKVKSGLATFRRHIAIRQLGI